jgi:uncharacterized membrane-anchored protein
MNHETRPMSLPPDHVLRKELNDEVHARPPLEMETPAKISYFVLLSDAGNREAERDHLRRLFERMDRPAPTISGSHLTADFSNFRLKWERHTEFARYTIVSGSNADDALAYPAIKLLPGDWLADLKGSTLVATNIALLPPPASISYGDISAKYFSGNPLTGSTVGDGAAIAITDFHIAKDGFSRLLFFNNDMSPTQTGRMVQRLLEIDTYRIMALLAFPIARELSPFLAGREAELAEITAEMTADKASGDQLLLSRLIQLEAAIKARYDNHHYRFRAAEAYAELVSTRIADLREQRLAGFQPLGQFMERRLTPAMSTCRSVSRGIEALSRRVGRSTQLLSTRVGIVREHQNQKLLEGMARRAKLQLRLQQTVEGLSVAAISYYVVGLIGYAAKAIEKTGLPVIPEAVMGISLPFVVIFAAFGIRNIRKRVSLDSADAKNK